MVARPPAAPHDALDKLVPVIPSTQRTFARDDEATAFCRVYQGGRGTPAGATLDVRILDERGVQVVQAPETIAGERFNAAREAEYRYDLPLAQLAPGAYLLTIEAKLGERSARRDVRFWIKK